MVLESDLGLGFRLKLSNLTYNMETTLCGFVWLGSQIKSLRARLRVEGLG